MALSPYRPHEYCQMIPQVAVPTLPPVNLQNRGEKVSINYFTITAESIARSSVNFHSQSADRRMNLNRFQ